MVVINRKIMILCIHHIGRNVEMIKPLIIIPAYNVSNYIEKLLFELEDKKSHCLIINDGSTDNTLELIINANFTIINKQQNEGLSKAILTGLKYALNNNYSHVILMDADGQHNPHDIDKIIASLTNSDVVFANRFTNNINIPSCKIVSNAFASAIYKEISNYTIPDIACGYKAFKLSQGIIDYLENTEGYSIVYQLVNYFVIQNMQIAYVPTKAIYYPDSLLYTRTEELFALLKSALNLNSSFDNNLDSILNDLLEKTLTHQNFSVILNNVEFYAFYIAHYNGYIFQSSLVAINYSKNINRRNSNMYTNDNFHPHLTTFPKHIALIPDGGRRWAQEHGCTYMESYSSSMSIIMDIIDFLFQNGTTYFSVFFASTSNFKRTTQEIHDFCTAEWNFINTDLLAYAKANNVSIKIIGTNNSHLKPYLQNIKDIEKQTIYGDKTIYICFNYSSLDEIEMALNQSSNGSESFVNYLQIPHPVDILIRTGDANVLSGFMLPQIASARIFFLKKLFNEFTLEDLKLIINDYLGYELKYGE